MPGYVVLPLVNGNAEVAVAAPWVNVVGAASNGGPPLNGIGGAHSFTWANGNFDFQQDVAVPGAEWAAIDAGTKRVLYSAWVSRALNPTPTITLDLYALSATNVVLQQWTYAYNNGVPENWQLEATVPALTRAFRVRASGFDWGGRAYFDDAVLALDDFALRATKAIGYAVEGFPLQTLGVPKGMAYGVLGPAAGSRVAITKALLYGVIGFSAALRITKAMAYVVVGPEHPCVEYPSDFITPCAGDDRPQNSWGACATRPDSVADNCGQASRPEGNSFYPGQPYPRPECH